jgi:hypothetical protein
MFPISKTSFYSMKKYFLVLLLFCCLSSFGQAEKISNPIGKFAFSIEPLGILQFGPMINAEFGLTDNLALNIHYRYSTIGLLTNTLWYSHANEKLKDNVFGTGLKYLFGDRMGKPYIGGLLEYGRNYLEYNTFIENNSYFGFVLNGGYRLRFKSGLYLNTGSYFGLQVTPNLKVQDTYWNTTETVGTESLLLFMLEFAIGFEF